MGSPHQQPRPAEEGPVGEDPVGEDAVTLTGWLSSVSKTGHWRVPKVLRLHRRGGSTQLDLTEADIAYDAIAIELDVIGGSVEMRVPEETSVNLDGLAVGLGSAEDHRGGPPAGGKLHVDIVGNLRWGSLEVRGPKRWPFTSFRS